MVKLLIVDDHPIFRAGAVTSLTAEPDFEVLGEAASAPEALRLVRELQPDVILTDIRLKGDMNGIELARRVRAEYPHVRLKGDMNGIELARRVRAEYPHVRLIVLTNYSNDPYIKAMMEIGVEAYILKDTPPREVVESVRMVMDGRTVFSAPVTQTILKGYIKPSSNGTDVVPNGITDREADVLRQLVDGASNSDIAARLHLSIATVQFHLTNIYSKLGVRNRSQAITKATRDGLVVIDE